MPTANLPTFLPLPEAAVRFGMTEAILYERVEAGTIAAGILSSGEIVVSRDNIVPKANNANDINDRLRAIRREDFEHLRGEAITVTEAAEKYGKKYGKRIIRQTVFRWVQKNYVSILEKGSGTRGMQLDQADVAYCAAVYITRRENGIRSGAPLLDDDGNPYLLKHPNLSRYRRERHKTA